MRKNIIALMLIIPLLFLFTVFSATNVATLGVQIKPNGIRILNKPENDALLIDLADPVRYRLEAEVSPKNASNRDYTFTVEPVEGSDFADVRVDGLGYVTARSTGVARVVASCKGADVEKDSLTVIVVSSKPYDFDFSLYSLYDSEKDLLQASQNGYSAVLPSGRYRYETRLRPETFFGGTLSISESETPAFAYEASHTLLLPFSGTVDLTVTVADGVNGPLIKHTTLSVEKAATQSGVSVNGGETTVLLEEGARTASFYVEADGEPTLSADGAEGRTVALGGSKYRIDVTFTESFTGELQGRVVVGENSERVVFSFEKFSYTVRADLPMQSNEDGSYSVTALSSSTLSFYAVPSMSADDVTYRWSCTGGGEVVQEGNGSVCSLKLGKHGAYTLTVQAYRGGEPLLSPVTIQIEAIEQVSAVQFLNKTKVGLAERYTVAGKRWTQDGPADNRFALNVMAYNTGGALDGLNDLLFTSSDEDIAEVISDGKTLTLLPKKSGEVTVTAEWKGNSVYGNKARATLTFDVAADAVEISTAPQLMAASEAGEKLVLTKDIMLGTDENGALLSLDNRRALLKEMRSTYNTEYYTNIGRPEDAKVNYLVEFKNDVYGNGCSINAEYLANARDGSNTPQLFRGPIWFVNYGEQLASVAGQDNIGFLIRTDGVTLYNLTLMNCNDSSLVSGGNSYDLSFLNLVGTTLEINADARILNCRIRNGRNVVRVYGGNRDGEHYFLNSLSENQGCDEERIHVTIEGCVLSQAREFMLKIGANRAVRATLANGNEPKLTDQSGKPYKEIVGKGVDPYADALRSNLYTTQDNGSLLDDDYFYRQYVLTDVTLKDSVLETCGFFCVGVESNFGGSYLNKNATGLATRFDGWTGTGGTSFASILRLEGDVRAYDWKDLSLVDSSTLIDTLMADLKLDVAAMLNFVSQKYPDEYGNIIEPVDGKQYVHGGIAFYGGGRNYSQISLDALAERCQGYNRYDVNISILQESEDESIQHLGEILPRAAGTQNFRFFMYASDGPNSYKKQLEDEAASQKYLGIKPLRIF